MVAASIVTDPQDFVASKLLAKLDKIINVKEEAVTLEML